MCNSDVIVKSVRILLVAQGNFGDNERGKIRRSLGSMENMYIALLYQNFNLVTNKGTCKIVLTSKYGESNMWRDTIQYTSGGIMSFISSIPSSGDSSSLICHIASSGDGIPSLIGHIASSGDGIPSLIGHILVSGYGVRHCGGDIGCVGFSWNDRGGGGGGWRKNYLIIHCHWSWG